MESDVVSRRKADYREPVPQLQLTLSTECNLACSYCSFVSRRRRSGRPVRMSAETLRAAASLFVNGVLAPAGSSYARVDFGVSGEPYLYRDYHDEAYEIVTEALKGAAIKTAWVGPWMSTGRSPPSWWRSRWPRRKTLVAMGR